MTYKKPVWALLMVVLALVAASCATPTPQTEVVTQIVEVTSAPQKQDIRLVVWFLSGSPEEIQINRDLMDKWAASYDKANVTIDFTSMGFEDFNNAMKLALDAHSGPDLAYGSPGAAFTTAWGEAGHLMDLTSFVSDRGIDQKVPEDIIWYYNPGGPGHLFALEYDAVAIGAYYNADMFDQLGLSVPTTIDEFEQLLADLKAAGVTPIANGSQTPWTVDHIFDTLSHANTPWDKYEALETCKGPVPDEWLPALQKLHSWIEAGYFNENALATSVDDGANLFLTQQAAMDIAGTWNNSTFGAQTDFTARFFAVPAMNPSLPEFHLAGFTPNNGWMVPVYGEHQEAALDLTEYMVASEDSAIARWNGGNIVAYKFASVPEPVYPLQADVYAAMQGASTGVYDGSISGEIGPAMNAAMQAMWGNEMTPEETIVAIQAAYDNGCANLAANP